MGESHGSLGARSVGRRHAARRQQHIPTQTDTPTDRHALTMVTAVVRQQFFPASSSSHSEFALLVLAFLCMFVCLRARAHVCA